MEEAKRSCFCSLSDLIQRMRSSSGRSEWRVMPAMSLRDLETAALIFASHDVYVKTCSDPFRMEGSVDAMASSVYTSFIPKYCFASSGYR